MTWDGVYRAKLPFVPPVSLRTYDITQDILSFRRCPRQYGLQKEHGFAMAQPAQRFVGAVIHSVLDLLVRDYHGTGGVSEIAGIPPTQDRVELHYETVKETLARQNIRPLNDDNDRKTLERLTLFNAIEGPSLYPRVRQANFRLEALLGAERMTARVDLVRTDEEDSAPVQLWIYKGSKPPREEDEDFAARSTDNELHARVMAELYRANRDSYPDAVVIYFLGALPGDPEGAKLAFADFGLGSQRSALDRLNETIHEIQECRVHQEWDPPEDGAAQAGPETCDVCPFRWSCPKANVGPPEFEGVREP